MASRLLTEMDTAEEVRKLVKGSKAQVAIAYWGAAALDLLGLDAAAKGTKVICNLESGCTDPATIRQLRSMLGEENVKTHAGLHAKICIGSNGAIIGSSNASTRGLAGKNSWREANLFCDDNSVLQNLNTWFIERWNECIEVSDKALISAELAWADRDTPKLPRRFGILNTALADPKRIAEHVWVVLWEHDLSPKKQTEARKKRVALLGGTAGSHASLDYWSVYERFQSWPKNGFLIECHVPNNGKPKYSGLYRTPEDSWRVTLADGGWADFAIKVNTMRIGKVIYHLPASERRLIENNAPHWVERFGWNRPIPLSKVLHDLEGA